MNVGLSHLVLTNALKNSPVISSSCSITLSHSSITRSCFPLIYRAQSFTAAYDSFTMFLDSVVILDAHHWYRYDSGFTSYHPLPPMGNERSFLYVYRSAFRSIFSNRTGGTIFAENLKNITIHLSTFYNCESSKSCGVFYLFAESTSIRTTSFMNCLSPNDAVGIVGANRTVLLDRNFFYKCSTRFSKDLYDEDYTKVGDHVLTAKYGRISHLETNYTACDTVSGHFMSFLSPTTYDVSYNLFSTIKCIDLMYLRRASLTGEISINNIVNISFVSPNGGIFCITLGRWRVTKCVFIHPKVPLARKSIDLETFTEGKYIGEKGFMVFTDCLFSFDADDEDFISKINCNTLANLQTHNLRLFSPRNQLILV